MIRYCVETVGTGVEPDRLSPMTDRFTANREYKRLLAIDYRVRLYRCEVISEDQPKG